MAHNMVAEGPSDIVNVSPTKPAIGLEHEELELDGNTNSCAEFTQYIVKMTLTSLISLRTGH
jgi:hypothetical protein